MNTNAPLAIVAGAGPGLGRALVQRFQKGGYHSVGLVEQVKKKDRAITTSYHFN